jgi:hypothetical protein
LALIGSRRQVFGFCRSRLTPATLRFAFPFAWFDLDDALALLKAEEDENTCRSVLTSGRISGPIGELRIRLDSIKGIHDYLE